MAYTSYDQFLTEIRQYAHAAPPIMIRTHIRNAIINFCERTFILKQDPSSFYLDEDEHTYTLKFSGDRYIAIAVKDIQLGEGVEGQSIAETTQHFLDNTVRGWRTHEAKTPNAYMLTDDTNKIRFYPTPNADSDEEIFVTCAVRPARAETEVDSFIYEKWEETIQAGALANLLSIPESSWYNKALAAQMAAEYKRGVRRARKTTTVGTTEMPGQVVPQNFITIGTSNNSNGRGISWD